MKNDRRYKKLLRKYFRKCILDIYHQRDGNSGRYSINDYRKSIKSHKINNKRVNNNHNVSLSSIRSGNI